MSVIVKGPVGLTHVGNLYNCIMDSHSIIAVDEEELIADLGYMTQQSYKEPFDGNGFTWSFVRDDSAETYDIARKHPEYRPNAQAVTTRAASWITAFFTHVVYPSERAYEVVDWVDANCKGRVLAWTLPCTEEHFYLFENPQEAVAFKLQVAA